MAAAPKLGDRVFAEAPLDFDFARSGLTRVERAREVIRVERGRIDGLLQITTEVDMRKEEQERPLVLLVTPRRSEADVGLAAAQGKRRRERRPRSLLRLERARQPLLEPEHLRSRPEAEPELRDDGRSGQPTAARRGSDEIPVRIGDVDMAGVAGAQGTGGKRRLADPWRRRRRGNC